MNEEEAGRVEEASAALCEHIRRRGFELRMFSDISIAFMGKEYQLHRIVLSQSSYFMSLLSGPWKENGKSKIQLQIDDPNVTHHGLETALSFLYGASPLLSADNVSSVLAASCFLCLDNLCDICVSFILRDLRVETFLSYQQLSERHCYGRYADALKDACWAFLCSHASSEFLHVLPKLSLQVLCRLIKSDEIWVPNESERHRLAKQALLEWRLAQMKASNAHTDPSSTRKQKPKSTSFQKNLRCKSSRNKLAPRSRNFKRKGSPPSSNEISSPLQKGFERNTDFHKLRRLWGDFDPDSNVSQEDIDMCIDLFTGGGIIYAHMDVDNLLLVKKELEEANLATDAINDSLWQNALLHAYIVRLGRNHARAALSDDDDLEMDDEDDDDDDDDDDEDEDEVDYDDDDDESSDRDSDESSSRIAMNTESPKRLRVESPSLVSFSRMELNSADVMDSKRRKTTSGFSWVAKPDAGMRLKDFPPFRYGVEFYWKENHWNLDAKYKGLFYGGSLWSIAVTNLECETGWHFGVCCYSRKNTHDSHLYSDSRKKVRFLSRLYIKTNSGLWFVTGTGLRNDPRNPVGMQLTPKDVNLDELLRVSAIVQLIDD